MKNKDTVINEFNSLVNMTASELETWLKSDESNSAGWPKVDKDGNKGSEAVGHDSGRKIVEILESNPDRERDKYTDEQVEHMRKVVGYCHRHLFQEKKSIQNKSIEEAKKTKAYASLMNWGHDPLRALGKGKESKSETERKHEKDTKDEKETDVEKGAKDDKEAKSEKKDKEESEASIASEEDEDESTKNDKPAKADTEEDKETGSKRKKTDSAQDNEPSKKRETTKGGAASKKTEEEEKEEKEETKASDKDVEKESEADSQKEEDGGAKKGPSKGDTVSWKWGGGNPEGKVLDVKGEKTSIETKKGNEVTRKGNPEDPAVVLDTGKSKAIKSAHELNEVD